MENADLTLVDPSLLPPQMRQLVECIGLPETMRLLMARGGTFLHVPVSAESATLLTAVLSRRAIAALATSPLAGRRIELPKADKIVIQLRNIAIRAERRHASAAAVARRHKLTRRQVINITRAVDDNPTPDLFEACARDKRSAD